MSYFKSKAFQYGLLAITCFVFYGNTIPNDYAYDDSVVITENEFTQRGIAGIPEIFGSNTFRGSYGDTPTVERYRPLSVATFAIEHQFFGRNPHVSHFNNVLLLGLVSLVLYEFLSKVFAGRDPRRGLLDFPLTAALLFIAHPVHTEIVANIKGRDELLVLAGALSATLLVLRYLDTREYRYLAWSFLLFSVALFSKENAITFLAIVPLTIYYYRDEKWSFYLRSLAPLAAASAVFFGARWLALGGGGSLPQVDIITEPFAYATLSERFATAIHTLGIYLRLLVFPHPLTIDYYPYHVQLVTWRDLGTWASALIWTALTLHALWNLRKKSVISWGILFFLFSFSIVSNLPFSIGTFMSERFMFVPSLGFVVIVAWLLSTRVFPATKHAGLLLTLVAAPCLYKTYTRNEQWKDDFTLFTTDVGTSSDSIKANLAASVSLLEESQKVYDAEQGKRYRASALEYAKRAVSIYEDHVDLAHVKGTSYGHAITLLGDCYSANEILDSALLCYEKAFHWTSNREQLFETIEATISKSKDLDFKLRSYLGWVALAPENFMFNYRLGYLYGREKNDLAKAVHYLQKAVDVRPDETHALEALSHAYKLSKDYEKAVLYLEQAATVNPSDSSYPKKLLALYRLAGNQAKERDLLNQLGQLQ